MLTKAGWRLKFKEYPNYLERAAKLLGENHFLYSVLHARRCFFEGFLIALENENPNREAGYLALQKFEEALRWQKDLALVYWQMSKLYAVTLFQADSMEYFALKAIDLQPEWLIPYELLASSFLLQFQDPTKAVYFLEKAENIDSSSSLLQNIWGIYYSSILDLDKSEYHYKRAIQLDSLMGGPYINLGILYIQKAQYDKAIPLFEFLIAHYPDHEWAYRNLGTVYFIQGQYEQAEKLIRKSLVLDSNFMETHIRLAELLFQTGRNKEAEWHYIKATQLNPYEPYTWYYLALFYSYSGQWNLAENTIKQAETFDTTKAIVWVTSAHLNLRKNQLTNAEVNLLEAMSLDSMLAEIYSEMAYLNIKKSQFDKVFILCNKSLKLYPGNYWAMIYMAILQLQIAGVKESMEWIDKAIRNGALLPVLQSLDELAPIRHSTAWKELVKKYFPKYSIK